MTSSAISSPSSPSMRTVLIASCAGSMIEWYDFFIFGSLAAILAHQFYPPNNPTASFIETLATFAVGFAVRPIGALFLATLAIAWAVKERS